MSDIDEINYMKKINECSSVEVVRKVVRDMRRYRDDPGVVEYALYAFIVLSVKKDHRDKMIQYKVIPNIVDGIKTYSQKERILSAGFCCLKNLPIEPYDLIIRQGLAINIVRAMRRFPENIELITRACAIMKICSQLQCCAQRFFDLDAAVVLRNIMLKHRFEPKLLKSAISCAWSFASHLEQERKTLFDLGLIHYTVETMRGYPDQGRLQEYGSALLLTIDYPYALMHLNGYEAILEAMKVLTENSSLLYHGCEAIRKYAGIQQNSEFLLQHNAGSIIIQALKNHPSKKKLQFSGCQALWSLGQKRENREKLMEQGIAKFLVNMTVDFKGDSKLFEAVCGLITNLTVCPEQSKVFFRKLAGETLVQGGKLHPNNERVQHNVLCALHNFTFIWKEMDHEREFMESAGVVEVVQSAVKNFPQNKLIVKAGSKILKSLAELSSSGDRRKTGDGMLQGAQKSM